LTGIRRADTGDLLVTRTVTFEGFYSTVLEEQEYVFRVAASARAKTSTAQDINEASKAAEESLRALEVFFQLQRTNADPQAIAGIDFSPEPGKDEPPPSDDDPLFLDRVLGEGDNGATIAVEVDRPMREGDSGTATPPGEPPPELLGVAVAAAAAHSIRPPATKNSYIAHCTSSAWVHIHVSTGTAKLNVTRSGTSLGTATASAGQTSRYIGATMTRRYTFDISVTRVSSGTTTYTPSAGWYIGTGGECR
jgi:hypothetical protein